ncbi:MAG: DNA polymerase Y family protein, partial [Candidatus Eremiobacteraeota bacterium]|nr:DNA polymerase Y family protein [Candidatus Eremiobacteraeota bacterium]
MQYSVALSVVPELRADCLCEQEIQAASQQVAGLLRKFSPELEIAKEQSGVFWLGAGGLEPLFGSL